MNPIRQQARDAVLAGFLGSVLFGSLAVKFDWAWDAFCFTLFLTAFVPISLLLLERAAKFKE